MFEEGEELAAAAVAAAANSGSASTLPSNLRHGAAVTLAYFTLYYLFIVGQIVTKKRLARMYKAQDKKFDRYGARDRDMLGWDRSVANMLEQMGPFLGFFWVNILLCPYGGLPLVYITAAGWVYVLLRSLYPVLWFNGGGGPQGSAPLLWRSTLPMYTVIIGLFANAIFVTSTV